jgi:L-alanine-DL-glutamate epimerase-like enolase superfamily enzyme
MKITGFETSIVRMPRDSGGPAGATVANFVTLRLRTDSGLEGIGYAGFFSTVMTASMKSALDALCEETVGADPWMIEAITQRLLALAGGGTPGGRVVGSPAGTVTYAVSAIDVALWDINAKAAGVPLYKLLGGYRDRVPTYASGHLWRDYDLKMLAETGPKLVDQGYRAMKFRLGAEKTVAAEVERVRVMREAVGPDIDLMIDINQGWSPDQAIVIGRHLADYGIYWLEDPTHHEDYAGLARIAAALDTPIAAGEYQFGIPPFRHMLEQRSIDIVMSDLMRDGGISGFMKAGHLAEAFNLPIVTHLAPEILIHPLAALSNGLTAEWMPWSTGMFKELPKLKDGELLLPDRPGLGLEFDEQALAKYAA